MSLLQKASIITTPTAYAEDYLYSIKPAYALGSELVTNGTFATDSGWTKGSAWTISGGKAVYDDSAINSISQSLSFTSQKRYQIQFEVSDATGSGARIKFSNVADSVIYFDYAYYTNGLHTLFYKASANSSEINIKGHTFGSSFKLDNVSVKEVTDADFDFDRNSTGTRVNEDYLIEDVPYNLIPYSEEVDNGAWDKVGVTIGANVISAPDGTLTGDKLKENSGGTYHNINHDDTVNGGIKYTASAFFKLAERTTASIYENLTAGGGNYYLSSFNLSNGTVDTQHANHIAKIEVAGNGWYRCSITFTPNATRSASLYYAPNNQLTYTGVTDNGVYMWGAQLVKGDKPKDYLKTTDRLDIPRIDYTNGEGSILLEPQRQNLLTYSQDFTQWGNARTTDTANQITSPDGLNNGTLLQQQSGQTNAGSIFINVSLSSGTYTQSIYAKKKDKNFIVGYDANAARTYFNLETGKVGTVASGVTAEMIAMPNDWYRCIITYTITTGAVIAFYLADNDNSTTVTDSGGVYIYGAQLEVGSYPTSLIHTSGSTVTRSQDLADNAGNSDLINSTEGVFYLHFAAFTGAGAFDDLSLSDGTQNNKVQLFYRATDKINARVTVGGVTVFDYIYQSIDMTEFEKVAIKWKLNDFSMYVDGREVNSDSSGATFSANTLNEVKINDNNISDYEGKIKCLAVFKEALTDLELEKLTGYNNHELYMNYYNRLSYLGLVEEYNVESDINNYIL